MAIPCAILWPGEDPAEQLLHWGFIAGKLGAAEDLPRPFLVGIRGAAPFDAETHQPVHRPQYDDTFVLLAKGSAPVVFAGATHAYQRDVAHPEKPSGVPDLNKDGRPDIGSIRCGRFLLKDKRTGHYPIFELTLPDGTKEIPAHRDTDHDGVISEAEARLSEQARSGDQVGSDGCYATSVLFHTGWDAPADSEHKSSIACQTCSLKWLELMSKSARASSGVIDYVLANAADLVPLAEERRRTLAAEPKPSGNVA